MSFFGGISRPARGAGFALIAIAVIAAVIGGITLLTGDDRPGNVAGGPGESSRATSGPGDGESGGATPTDGAGSTSSTAPSAPSDSAGSKTAPPQQGQPSGPSSGQPGRGGQAGGETGAPGANGETQQVPVRVYNNSKIKGLASRAAADLREQGWKVAKVDNYPEGVIPKTTAYYRPHTPEKAAALSLAAAFGMRAKPRFEGIDDAHPGLIIIVTKNYKGPVGKSG